jgi:RNA ligase (TIGR02306 family)
MWDDGEDVTEYLGIVKWEPNIPAQLAGIMRGNFPSFIQKTDQERIQNIKRQFEDAVAAGEEFEVTEKLHGSSMTVYFNNGDFGVCSRNIDLKESEENAFWNMAKLLNLKEKLETYGKNIALQGELIGNGIQGNQYYLPGHGFHIFDVYDIDAGGKMLPGERQAVLRDLGLQFVNEVPQLLPRYKFSPETTISDVLKMAESYSMLNGSEREGLVFKSLTRDFSFKAISNKWLLNNE